MTNSEPGDIVRASELGEYAYCARAWWLRHVQGVESTNTAALQSGQAVHDRHGRAVSAFQLERRLAWIVAGLAVLIALAALALALGGSL